MGTTASRVAQASNGTVTRQQVAEHFSENPITYHNTLQSSMTNNPGIAALFIEALMTPDRGKGISSGGSIALWKQLNLSAGKILPEALSDQEWNDIIDLHLDAIMTQKDYVRDSEYLRDVRTVPGSVTRCWRSIHCARPDGGAWRVWPAETRHRNICQHPMGTTSRVPPSRMAQNPSVIRN